MEGFPNVAYVIGSRATLVVDTGLGERNGATVMRAEQKLAKGPILYLTTTHYHSEHTTGEQAFPASAIIIQKQRATGRNEAKSVGAHCMGSRVQENVNMRLKTWTCSRM